MAMTPGTFRWRHELQSYLQDRLTYLSMTAVSGRIAEAAAVVAFWSVSLRQPACASLETFYWPKKSKPVMVCGLPLTSKYFSTHGTDIPNP
jgi:hypothetical protein